MIIRHLPSDESRHLPSVEFRYLPSSEVHQENRQMFCPRQGIGMSVLGAKKWRGGRIPRAAADAAEAVQCPATSNQQPVMRMNHPYSTDRWLLAAGC